MRRYSCQACQNEIHFDNATCFSCHGALGYDPASDQLLVSEQGVPRWRNNGNALAACANRTLIGCNWLVPETAADSYCLCCRHTQLIPDLSLGDNLARWIRLERAKRALFYSILKFRLPTQNSRFSGDNPLLFAFKADAISFSGWKQPVVTGHEYGLVTINIAEADDVVRERQRKAVGEPYRTLIGHFRHEIGHYYWDRLVANTNHLWNFRNLFGNESLNYMDALNRHYNFGAQPGWEQFYVSAYASSHPWEDFAETWAHYFHIVDGLETARSYNLNFSPAGKDPAAGHSASETYEETDFNKIIDEWIPLTIAMNAINRSIGNSDFYPFVLSNAIFGKLHFVHELVSKNDQH